MASEQTLGPRTRRGGGPWPRPGEAWPPPMTHNTYGQGEIARPGRDKAGEVANFSRSGKK